MRSQRGAGASGGQGVSPPGNPTATTTSGSELKRELDSGRQRGPERVMLLWEGRQDKRPHSIPVCSPPCPLHCPAGLTGSKAGSSKRAAGHLRKNSSGVVKGRPRFRANCGREGKSAGVGWGGVGWGQAPEGGTRWGTHQAVCTREVFLLAPRGPVGWASRCVWNTEPGLHQHPWGQSRPPHQHPAPTHHLPSPRPLPPTKMLSLMEMAMPSLAWAGTGTREAVRNPRPHLSHCLSHQEVCSVRSSL